MDDSRTAEPEQHAAVRSMIPLVEGRPVVNVRGCDGAVCVCRRISGLHVAPEAFPEELCLYGACDWADPPEARPDELTDGMVIGCGDGLRLGPGWWYDAYFDWYFVYEPALVARSLSGDHSWVAAFLGKRPSRGAEPGAAADRAGGTSG